MACPLLRKAAITRTQHRLRTVNGADETQPWVTVQQAAFCRDVQFSGPLSRFPS